MRIVDVVLSPSYIEYPTVVLLDTHARLSLIQDVQDVFWGSARSRISFWC